MLGIMALRIAKLSSLLCLLVVVLAVLDGASGSDFCTQVVTPLGYGCTQFSVETNDGFVLVMHRLKRVQPVGDAHISGTAQPHVQNSVGPNFVDLVPASESMVYSADHDGLRHASDSASSTLERPKLGPHLCSCSCSCSDGNTTRTASTCFEPDLARNASRSSTPEQPFTRSSDANDPAPNPGAQPIHSNNSCSCSCSSSASQEPECSLSNPASQTPAPATNGSKHTDPAQVHRHSTGSAATAGARNDGMLPDEPGRSSAAPDAPSVSRIQNVSGFTGCSSPSNRTAHPRAGKGSPVLLMHMEFVNGDSGFKYVDADRHVSSLLPILLLEDGFDVWIGHQRATYWGHGHVKYKSTDREYWNWSWDEHAKCDLPVQLRFISTETNQSLHFIGASQAATVALAAATDHKLAQTFCGNSNSTLLNLWAYDFGAFLDSGWLNITARMWKSGTGCNMENDQFCKVEICGTEVLPVLKGPRSGASPERGCEGGCACSGQRTPCFPGWWAKNSGCAGGAQGWPRCQEWRAIQWGHGAARGWPRCRMKLPPVSP